MEMVVDSMPFVHPADHVPGPRQGAWTYANYAALPDDGQRYEIIDGVLYMPPAPGAPHQSASTKFATYLTIHVEFAGLGRVFHAPFDVELAPNTVVQPDVVVVLNDNLGVLKPSRIIGAPDLVIEVISPSTGGYDRRQKQDAYARAGVREYWIADPHAQTVELLRLQDDSYRVIGVYHNRAILPSEVIPNMPVRVEQFFA